MAEESKGSDITISSRRSRLQNLIRYAPAVSSLLVNYGKNVLSNFLDGGPLYRLINDLIRTRPSGPERVEAVRKALETTAADLPDPISRTQVLEDSLNALDEVTAQLEEAETKMRSEAQNAFAKKAYDQGHEAGYEAGREEGHIELAQRGFVETEGGPPGGDFPGVRTISSIRTGERLFGIIGGIGSLAAVIYAWYNTKGGEKYIKLMCLGGVLDAIAPNLGIYSPVLMLMVEMLQEKGYTGDVNNDRMIWNNHVDAVVTAFEEAYGMPINEMFSDDFISTFETQTGQSGEFFRDRDRILEIMHNSTEYQTQVEKYLSKPLTNFSDHSATIQDRFGIYLPEWLLTLNPGVRVVGNVDKQPAINLKAVRVLGFTYMDEPKPQKELGKNPFELFDKRPEGYNYFGPGNPLPNGEPKNTLDEIGRVHDYAYAESGYNTPGAKEADRVMVKSIMAAIESGEISELKDKDEYKYAMNGLRYFALIDMK